MSSTRRSANEIHILAMLDRHEGRGLPQRLLRGYRRWPALLRYGAAGVLVCGLFATLAWVARDDGADAAADTALAGAIAPVQVARPAAEAARTDAAAVANPVADPVADAGSSPGSDAEAQGGATVVDLAPAPPDMQLRAQAAAPAALARTLPPQHEGRIMHKTTPRPVLARAGAETRRRRPVQPPKPAPAEVDTDVALISAIIQHANSRQEAADEARKP
jgi:hypothetical protein